jgi:hypothetical protein
VDHGRRSWTTGRYRASASGRGNGHLSGLLIRALRMASDAAVARTFRFLVVGFGVQVEKPSSTFESNRKLRTSCGTLYISLFPGQWNASSTVWPRKVELVTSAQCAQQGRMALFSVFRLDCGRCGSNPVLKLLPGGRLFDRNAQVEHRSLDACIGDSAPTEYSRCQKLRL